MAKHNTNSRTVENFRKRGFLAQTVEQWIDYAGVRRDLFGFIDIITAKPGEGIIGVQATTYNQRGDHCKAMLANSSLIPWLESGARCQLYSWRLVAEGKRLVWRPRVQEALLQNGGAVFVEVETTA
jgi:hypothetical protein